MMTAAVTKKETMTQNKAVYALHRQEAREEYEVPNAETIQAMKEAYAQIASRESGTMNIDEFFAEIEADA